jgi:putative cell wall-binding protein
MNKKLSYFISSIVLVASMALFPAQSALAGNKTSSRYHGSNRYSTATSIANKLKHDKFNNVVIAYGYNFPDALSGSVLASKVNAPILLVGNSVNNSTETINYIT